MNTLEALPGNIVVTQFGLYQHWSIVSDQLCSVGKNMLISATKRTGTVEEEPWDQVTQGKHTYIIELNSNKPVSKILSDARSQIGLWAYSVADKNCEHFVKWSSDLKVSSSQVSAVVGGGLVGGVAVATLAENPKALKILGGAAIVAGIALMASKAVENKSK